MSPASTARAQELCDAVGVRASFVVGDVTALAREPESFDRIAGSFALHHVELADVAPALADLLRPGGTAVFLETMGMLRLLPFLRRHVTAPRH